MQAYKELSAEMGRRKRLEAAGGGGTEASRAGKMRSRRSGAHASWVDSVAGRERSSTCTAVCILNYATCRFHENCQDAGFFPSIVARRLQKAACDSTYEEGQFYDDSHDC